MQRRIVRHYARHARRSSSIQQKDRTARAKGWKQCASCVMPCVRRPKQVLAMLRPLGAEGRPDASREIDTARVAASDQLYESALAVKALANNESSSREDLGKGAWRAGRSGSTPTCAQQARSQIRQCLLRKRPRTQSANTRRQLPFETEGCSNIEIVRHAISSPAREFIEDAEIRRSPMVHRPYAASMTGDSA